MPARTSLTEPGPPSAASLQRLERLVSLLDDKFVVPGTRWRFGLDGVFGLLPVVGNSAGMLFSLYLVFEAKRLGAPNGLILRMLGNVAVDGVAGSVPVLGDLLDFAFKANRRNLALLRRHLGREDGTL